LGD
ncbi:hypothetical protein CP082626L3_1689, partial [Chlamydia psittaci 08-2626_L3]|jgi:hypothetical protein